MAHGGATETSQPLARAEQSEFASERQRGSESFCDRFAVTIVFVVYVSMRAMDRIFNKDINNALQRASYNTVWSNIFWPFVAQLILFAMLCVYVIYRRMQGDTQFSWRFFLPGNPMASSVGPVPLYQMALFSVGDQLNAALSGPASPFVTQAIQSVMTNSVLIWMAIIAFFWIKARFQQVHYLGIALVMMSIMVQISNKVTSDDCSEQGMQRGDCFRSYKDANGFYVMLSVGAMTLWYSLNLVSQLPLAASNVYKQIVLQGKDVDVCYAAWWSGNFQILWGWLCVPLMWIPLPGQETLGPAATFQEIGNTLSCIAGNVPRPGDETCATSPPPYVWAIAYFVFNASFNLALLWLTKRMSAAWAQVSTVLCLNLTGVLSQFKFLAGDNAEWLTLYDYLALILASLALWAYNMAPETSKLTQVTGDSNHKVSSVSAIKNENEV